ncbi:hypothetical protein ABTX61_09105 [Amycolatopsis japonica]|uniref:hypothetical protein n=1 Tax=Amycolatopsis japonica TaxID=208439 RepID=UPI00332605CC
MTSSTPLGPAGNTATWAWEQVLNIFSFEPDYPLVPSREDLVAKPWLTWNSHTHARGPGNKGPGNMFTSEGMNSYTSYYVVADPTKEIDELIAKFDANGSTIIDSLQNNANATYKQITFDRAVNTLGGVAAWLTSQVAPLNAQRDKVGHRGDEFQGTGAGAFWAVLDGLAFTCRNLVDQMTVSDPISLGTTSWDVLREASELAKLAAIKLHEGRDRWKGGETFVYDTGLGFKISAPGWQLATPAGAVGAIWRSPEIAQDPSMRPEASIIDNRHGSSWPYSNFLGGFLSDAATQEKLELAAKRVWRDHLGFADSYGATAVGLLDSAYRMAARCLPVIGTPVRLNLLPGAGGGPSDAAPGPGNAGPGPGNTGPGGDGPENAPGPGNRGPGSTFVGPAPVPPFPMPNFKGSPPGNTVVPSTGLRVPSGSYVGKDGTIIGPNGKPVKGVDGRPIIVPPGSRVNGNGEIIGPNGRGYLDQKDRLRKAYPAPGSTLVGDNGESAMERYLKSLRRTPPTSLPPLRMPESLPSTFSKLDPLTHNGPGSTIVGKPGVSPSISTPLTTSLGGSPSTSPATGQPLGDGVKGAAPPKGTLGGPKSPAGSGSGMPLYPPTAGGGAGGEGQAKADRERDTWLAEDEETWGTDPTVAPGVLGRRKRTSRRHGLAAGDAGIFVNTEQDFGPRVGADTSSSSGQSTGATG